MAGHGQSHRQALAAFGFEEVLAVTQGLAVGREPGGGLGRELGFGRGVERLAVEDDPGEE